MSARAKADKRRYSLTLTRVYVEALDQLVEDGIYLGHPVAIRDALRRLFRHYGMKAFVDPLGETDGE